MDFPSRVTPGTSDPAFASWGVNRNESPPSRHPEVMNPLIDPVQHLEWAATIAGHVGRRYRFQKDSQERADLVSVAYLTLVRKCRGFRPEMVPAGGDPAGAFRGWVHPTVWKECLREARRLRNGGTYRTRQELSGVALTAEPFGEDSGMWILDHRDDEAEPPDDRGPARGVTLKRNCHHCGVAFWGRAGKDDYFCSKGCRGGRPRRAA